MIQQRTSFLEREMQTRTISAVPLRSPSQCTIRWHLRMWLALCTSPLGDVEGVDILGTSIWWHVYDAYCMYNSSYRSEVQADLEDQLARDRATEIWDTGRRGRSVILVRPCSLCFSSRRSRSRNCRRPRYPAWHRMRGRGRGSCLLGCVGLSKFLGQHGFGCPTCSSPSHRQNEWSQKLGSKALQASPHYQHEGGREREERRVKIAGGSMWRSIEKEMATEKKT
ncbi:hypothetical protein L209DRAFT_548623 [Thermothelomyces heterothallicus CBS 203.75]